MGELAQQLPITRSAVSQHLRVLKDGGLVVSRAEGTRRIYRLNPDGVTALRAYLDRVWEEALTAILEPRQGGRWYERGVDGSECDWGQVLAWEPPHRLVVTWQINGQWQYDPDPAHASEIEVRFSADGLEQTTVTLEHRHLERLVDGQALRDGITGGGGWTSLLELLAKATTDQV